jgi:glycerate kinase
VVVTGEGYLDPQSLDGKVVGGVCDLAAAAGKPVVVIAGDADPDVADEVASSGPTVVSLVDRYGEERPFREPRWCIEDAARNALRAFG